MGTRNLAHVALGPVEVVVDALARSRPAHKFSRLQQHRPASMKRDTQGCGQPRQPGPDDDYWLSTVSVAGLCLTAFAIDLDPRSDGTR